MKQVRYFEAMYLGAIEKHYTKDTADFKNWIKTLKFFDTATTVTYIAYDDGTTEGETQAEQGRLNPCKGVKNEKGYRN